MLIKTAFELASTKLKSAGIASAQMEARLLLSKALKKSKEYLISHTEDEIDPIQEEKFFSFTERRTRFEPIAYIIGTKEFFGRDFIVNHSTLIPRPDSEILVEAVVKYANETPINNILELGCGSGCLIITIALEMESKETDFTAIDISADALSVAKTNAQQLGAKIDFLESNWFENLSQNKTYDIIISNPPYISPSSTEVAKETLLHEPHIALFGGETGLKCYEVIASESGRFLATGGRIYLEIGYDQENAVREIFTRESFELLSIYKDLGGHSRCLCFRKL
ncbi:MAG: peptide chain release factor N(5)-glutamine methyltransferase [Rickettsiaceae bacterium]|nr:peptide chain release factor N(5)-glutamine methyltransferase [Rickettsiaceae bacterium]